MVTVEQVAQMIDHAVLKPEATTADVVDHAAMCRRRGIGCLCVRPCDIETATRELRESATTVGSVVGFPFGIQRSEIKARETELAIMAGAREIDMVMNVGRFLSGDTAFVQSDIAGVVGAAQPHGVIVKVILETCYLSAGQIAAACILARDAGADFVKTSTGFAAGGATPEAIAVMVQTVGETMGIKASGGIRTWEQAVGYITQGCTRLGIGASETVLDGGISQDAY